MRTATHTATATRLQLLEANLRVAVHRLHRNPERVIRRVLEPCIRGKFLRRLVFLGLDDNETIRAQLSLAVDWSEHGHLAAEKNHLHVDGRSMKQGRLNCGDCWIASRAKWQMGDCGSPWFCTSAPAQRLHSFAACSVSARPRSVTGPAARRKPPSRCGTFVR